MDALDHAARWFNSEHPRTPPTFGGYLSDLGTDELLCLSVGAQVASERTGDRDPARALLLRAIAATAADVMDARADTSP
jgi:hypothetical protein